MRSGSRILILVRQPDPRFTPRVWLVPIVHCQWLLMERQQWILSPHKWLSDRAPSSITSYNVEVQKMRPSGRLIWCFICSFEKLLSFFPPCKITAVQACSHMYTCKQNKSVQNRTVQTVCSVHAWLFFNLVAQQHLTWIQQYSAPWWKRLRRAFNQTLNLIAFTHLISPGVITLSCIVQLK